MGDSHEDQYTFMIKSRWIFLIMINLSDKSCKENPNTFYVQERFPENRTVIR